MLTIGGIRVDVDALLLLNHACRPALCKRGPCCQGNYEIAITGREMRRAAAMIPHAARYVPGLRDGRVFDNPFEPAGRNTYLIDECEDGACAFSFRNGRNEIRCSLHAAALDLGLNPYATKPAACTLWPLALSEDIPPVLSVQEEILRFPCNTAPRRPRRTLDPGIAEIIRNVFGPVFLNALESAIRVGS